MYCFAILPTRGSSNQQQQQKYMATTTLRIHNTVKSEFLKNPITLSAVMSSGDVTSSEVVSLDNPEIIIL